MGTYYQLFAEAKVNGEWKGIDFYVSSKDGYKPVEIIEGKSYIGSALRDKALDWRVTVKTLSPELKRDHPWVLKEEENILPYNCVSCVHGEDIEALNLDGPEFCGFVDKSMIRAFERGEAEDLMEWTISAKEYSELPAEARIGYEWYQWTERFGTHEVWQIIRRRLQERIDAYNNARFDYEWDKMPQEIRMSDCRVVILIS